MVCRCVWSRILVIEETLAHWGLLCQKQTFWFRNLREENFMELFFVYYKCAYWKKFRAVNNSESNVVDQQWTRNVRKNLAAVAVHKVAHLAFFFRNTEVLVLYICGIVLLLLTVLRKWRSAPLTFIDIFAVVNNEKFRCVTYNFLAVTKYIFRSIYFNNSLTTKGHYFTSTRHCELFYCMAIG